MLPHLIPPRASAAAARLPKCGGRRVISLCSTQPVYGQVVSSDSTEHVQVTGPVEPKLFFANERTFLHCVPSLTPTNADPPAAAHAQPLPSGPASPNA